ncbi:MAG: VWA domain-containing protein [Luteitalea sp.]|nr:VWA domain-containing protein [Luteitalea sp.]
MIAGLRALAHDLFGEWQSLTLGDLLFSHRSEARLILVALVGFSAVVLVARLTIRRRAVHGRVVLPAVFTSFPRSRGSFLMHVPLLIFLSGLPFLALALADPYTALVRREVTYPGRRICLAIDASYSMLTRFKTDVLKTQSETDAAFFTTVAAAERFIQLRMKGRFRDLVALVEFGNDAYVVTPFTHDYDNILLSLSLIGHPTEFKVFPDQRTQIARAIEESVELFKAFKFLDASGNMLVILSDGEDANAASNGRPLDDIMRSAVAAGVPVYFVRTNYGLKAGDYIPDRLWTDAVEKSGGRFFAASDEPSLLAAIREIDQVSAGSIQVKEYSSQRPRFASFAALAVLCFTAAVVTKLAVPCFQKFP